MRSRPVQPGCDDACRRTVRGFAAAVAIIVFLYLAFPALQDYAYVAVTAWAVAAIGWGVHRFRPAHPEAWLLLAATVAFFMASTATAFTSPQKVDAGPGVADWLSLCGYPLAAAGLLIMTRNRLPGRDRAGLLDAVITAGAMAFLAWAFLIVPYVHDEALSTAARVVAIAFPLADLVLLGIFARLMAPPASRNTTLWLLSAGMVGLMVSDVLEALARLRTVVWFDSDRGSVLLASGWVFFCVCWGAAALTPSMREATRPIPTPSRALPPARLALLGAAALVTPVAVAVQLARDDHSTGWFGPMAAGAVFVVILARISLVLAEHRRALGREKILLTTTGSLAAAAGVDEVAAALTAAVTRLLGARRAHEVVVSVENGAEFHVTAAGVRSDPVSTNDPVAWRTALTRLNRVGVDPSAAVPVAELPPAVAERLGGLGYALVFPLGMEAWPSGPWTAGLLATAADDEAELVALRSPLALLASQAALTLNRIALNLEIARRDGEAHFRALVQNTSDAILIVDPGQRVRYASPSAKKLFGRPALAGRPLTELVGGANSAEIAGWLDGMMAPVAPARRDWTLTAPSGAVHEVEATIADLRSEPTVGGFVISLHDVTTARGLERTLQRHAYHDVLTDLPNRLAFSRGLEDALELAGPDTWVSVVLLDLDSFREVNDVHGRIAGDRVLRAAADVLRGCLRPGDVLARTGSDEFAILQVRYYPEPPELPAHLDQSIGIGGEEFPLVVGPVAVTASGAVATGSAGSTSASLMADAELTLHAAKSAGPRTWRRYDPALRAELAASAARRTGLDQALRDGSLQLFYQPIVQLDTGVVIAFEALVRWPQPDGTIIAPDEFIPMAESTGQILPLGEWILRQATADAAAWNRTRAANGGSPLRVSVNVSAHQLRDPRFPECVNDALAAVALEPSLLALEATESSLIHRGGAQQANLRALTRRGVRLALDDFGTGYSSLSYLRDLPVTSLKIDKLFVDGIVSSHRQAALVQGIIGIAKSLDLVVVAEGIEEESQRRALAAMGAELGQGYLFAKPMPGAEAAALVGAGPVSRLPTGLVRPGPPSWPTRAAQPNVPIVPDLPHWPNRPTTGGTADHA